MRVSWEEQSQLFDGGRYAYDDNDGSKSILAGHTIRKILINAGHDRLVLVSDTATITIDVEGDCCSHSWIEHMASVQSLLGHTITGIKDVDMDLPEEEVDDYEYIKFYGAQFVTDNGVMAIDYRNSSNGYYGGALELVEIGPVESQLDSDFKEVTEDF